MLADLVAQAAAAKAERRAQAQREEEAQLQRERREAAEPAREDARLKVFRQLLEQSGELERLETFLAGAAPRLSRSVA